LSQAVGAAKTVTGGGEPRTLQNRPDANIEIERCAVAANDSMVRHKPRGASTPRPPADVYKATDV